MSHPFIPTFGHHRSVGPDSQLARIDRLDRRQCRAALSLPDLRRALSRAVERRLRQLEKGLA